jgi:hypothetical protein
MTLSAAFDATFIARKNGKLVRACFALTSSSCCVRQPGGAGQPQRPRLTLGRSQNALTLSCNLAVKAKLPSRMRQRRDSIQYDSV